MQRLHSWVLISLDLAAWVRVCDEPQLTSLMMRLDLGPLLTNMTARIERLVNSFALNGTHDNNVQVTEYIWDFSRNIIRPADVLFVAQLTAHCAQTDTEDACGDAVPAQQGHCGSVIYSLYGSI